MTCNFNRLLKILTDYFIMRSCSLEFIFVIFLTCSNQVVKYKVEGIIMTEICRYQVLLLYRTFTL